MRQRFLIWRRLIAGCVALLGVCNPARAPAQELAVNQQLPLVTNLLQFDRLAILGQPVSCSIRLRGVVAWANGAGNKFVLQDDSAAELVQMAPQGQTLHPGQEVILEGNCSSDGAAEDRRIGSLLLVDNDGVHAVEEKSGAVFLTAGRHPIDLAWFTRDTPPALTVYYQGPNLPRQRIPASAWFRRSRSQEGGAAAALSGLDYQCYVGDWWRLPDFQYLTPVKCGASTDVAVGVRTRDTNVALRFSGDIEVPRDGRYTFSTVSDGGSQLRIQLLGLRVTGQSAPPQPRPAAIGQILSDGEDSQWSVLQGTVDFVGNSQAPGLELELTSPAGRMRVRVGDASGVFPGLLLNSRIKATGILRRAFSLEGQMIPGALWVPDGQQIQVLEPPLTFWSSQPVTLIRDILASNNCPAAGGPLHVRAALRPGRDGEMALEDATGQVSVQGSLLSSNLTNRLLDVVAIRAATASNVMLRSVFFQVVKDVPMTATQLPTLTTVEQIKRLKRGEALRGYPVHVSGAITWSAGSAVVIQDSTAGIFVSEVPVAAADGPRRGEYWDIEGITYAQFSPMILARRVTRRGLGALPEPLHPTWDQLINGTLDTQYVEVRGIVTEVQSNALTLLTHGGKIHLDLPERRAADLQAYDSTLVRVRGCLWATKDDTTHEFKIGEVEMHDAVIEVDQPAPDDPFAAPLKRLDELLLFDAQAGAFQRVKVSGQVVRARAGEHSLMDGAAGLRFDPKSPVELQPGDQVQVVGFPELGGPSPLLREARVRKTGHAPLPQPKRLSEDTLFSGQHDATLVQIEAQLVKLNTDQTNQLLGLQAGPHTFNARLNAKPEAIQGLRPGSRLRLTGVYWGHGTGGDINSFELLLNDPADIRVIAQPPWWTLRRLLAAVGVLLAVLGIAAVWIGLLRRQIEQRTAQLRKEIHERERAEHQRAVEAERSRIARDLHDDLGSSLTEISLLADAGPGSPPSLKRAGQRFQTIGDKARAVVNALDVIVWLVNPRKDVLPFLIGYLGSYAEEYLSSSGIGCHLRIPRDIPSVPLSAEVRHSLFLAVKETLHNIVRHAHASEVMMELAVASGQLRIVIIDNGQGFDSGPSPTGNGVSNLHDRLAGIGGRCQIDSGPEVGTKVCLTFPLTSTPPNL